jgi:hypothetical protein
MRAHARPHPTHCPLKTTVHAHQRSSLLCCALAYRSQELRSDFRIDPNRVDQVLDELRTSTVWSDGSLIGGDMNERDRPIESISERASALHGRHFSHQFDRPARRRNHRRDQLSILQEWFDMHEDDPYPDVDEKANLSIQTGMEVRQVEHWFTNQRKRHWNKESHKKTGRYSAERKGAGPALKVSEDGAEAHMKEVNAVAVDDAAEALLLAREQSLSMKESEDRSMQMDVD